MTAAAGAINGYWLTYINAPSVFDMGIAVKSFVIFLLGGAATVLGPALAALGIELVATFTWSRFLNWHLAAMGMLIMLVILVFPRGLREAFRHR
jgi:branched-chain amino acid transport system permease protein